jgi:site-specific DNA-methyltransferase (adenine-specific)
VRLGQESVNLAVAAKLWAERRAGELLAQTVKPGRRWESNSDQRAGLDLPEGVTHKQSSRWQKLAAIPKDEFAEIIESMTAEGLSQAAILQHQARVQNEKAKKADRRKAARLAQKPYEDRCTLLAGDLLTAGAEIEPGSVDAIVTDPPYPKEYLDVWAKLGTLAERVLRPGGWLAAMVPQAHLPFIVDALGRAEGLTYRWTLAYLLPGGESVQLQSLRINVRWKPILLYTAGTMKRMLTFGGDVIANDVQDEDRHDEGWGQGVDGFTKLVLGVTRADETVLDPFLGSGTTAIAALTQGRRFVGIDVEQKYVDETWHRLSQVQQ